MSWSGAKVDGRHVWRPGHQFTVDADGHEMWQPTREMVEVALGRVVYVETTGPAERVADTYAAKVLGRG